MILISDIHGCYRTMLRLLRQVQQRYPDEGRVVLLGDLIDRGPHSKQVVEFARKNRKSVSVVMGNHEHLALTAIESNNCDIWYNNGGDATVKSFGGKIPASVLLWMRSLPISINEGGLLLSHTGHVPADCVETSLWARGFLFPDDGLYRVFGHTPQREPLINERFACIDTGAAYRKFGYGVMTALVTPAMEVVTQPYDESVLDVGYSWTPGKYYETAASS